MKKITIKKIKVELEKLGADPVTTESVIGLVQQHNDLVQDYNNDDKHQQYLLYQLKQQLHKVLMDLKKFGKQQTADTEPDYPFQKFMDNIKQKFETR